MNISVLFHDLKNIYKKEEVGKRLMNLKKLKKKLRPFNV